MTIQTDLFVGGSGDYHTYRIPALVVTSAGSVLCFAEGRKNGSGDSGDIDLLLKRSDDGGITWSPHFIVHEEGDGAAITIGNPCPIVDRNNVVHLLITGDNTRLLYLRSNDDGLTWSRPQDITSITTGFAYPTVRFGSGPGHGIEMASGRLVAPFWLCDGLVTNNTNRTYRSAVVYSDDGGDSWNAGGIVPPLFTQLNECTVFEQDSGDLMLNLRGASEGVRCTSISTDGGLNWSEPVGDSQLPCPVCQAGSLKLPGGALLFSNPAGAAEKPGIGRLNLTVRLSPDDGQTWPVAKLLYEGPSGYSDLAVLPDGNIMCVYECGATSYHEKIRVAVLSEDGVQRP